MWHIQTEHPLGGANRCPHHSLDTHEKKSHMDYTFLANLRTEFVLLEKDILSGVRQNDQHANVMLFGFAAGEALSAHSASTPAVLYFIEGETEVRLGEDKVRAEPGSFVYKPSMLSHGISAMTGVGMLLVQIKAD